MQAQHLQRADDKVVSLVSVAARYPRPSESHSHRAGEACFWEAMCTGADLSARVPLDRWDVDQHYSPDLVSKKMCAFHSYKLSSLDKHFCLEHVYTKIMLSLVTFNAKLTAAFFDMLPFPVLKSEQSKEVK